MCGGSLAYMRKKLAREVSERRSNSSTGGSASGVSDFGAGGMVEASGMVSGWAAGVDSEHNGYFGG